ncbi:wsc domain [Moniliophthora roreri]|nr:wsc domain [Moniliophthora roreri]
MFYSSLSRHLALLAVVSVANAWFRLPCTGPLVQERVDPILSPTQVPSQHVHTVHGAYSEELAVRWHPVQLTRMIPDFKANSTFDTLRASKCTSCQVAQDLSNYWFPKLYFRDPKTKMFEAVPNGGLLVYYQNRGSLDKANGGPGLKAFPPGFRMITGNPVARSKKYQDGLGTQAELAERAIAWACLRYTTSNPDYYGTGGFPHTDCEAGFQSRLHFPACWDGKNVDSADHRSHVAFLSILDNGSCPSTHPVGLMKLFYEITWDIHSFAGRWKESDGWPFVYATGDATGYSFHGDFQNGWDVNVLQNAIDKCNNPNDDTINGVADACSYFTMIPAANAASCQLPSVVNEEVKGPFAKLPGCNPIQAGPGDATLYTTANCPKGT